MSSASSAPAEAPTPSPGALSPADLGLLAQVRAALGLYVVGDTEGVLARSRPDCTYRIPGDPRALPWAGRYVGAGFGRFHEAIKGNIDLIDYVAPWTELWPDRALVLMRERARLRGSGGAFDQHLLGVFCFDGPLLAAYDEDSDPWAMEEAMAGRRAPDAAERPPPWIAEAGGWGGCWTRGSAAVQADGEGSHTAALAKAAAEAELRGDAAALRDAAHPALEVWVNGADPRLPGAGAGEGRGALAHLAAARASLFDRERISVEVDAFGGSALLRIQERLRPRGGGPWTELSRTALVGARAGALCRWWEWCDTAALGRILGAAPAR